MFSIRWMPPKRVARTGVPADHFPKVANRFVAVDHQGRVTALVADGENETPEIPVTPVVEPEATETPEAPEVPAEGETPEVAEVPALTVVTTPVTMTDLPDRIAAMRDRQKATPMARTKVKLPEFGDLEVELPVEWDETTGVFKTSGDGDTFAMVAAATPGLVDNPGEAWHAILCVEGLRTDEDPSREIMPMACQFPDLPVSLRLQIEDEGGHWGAITCGRIDTMDRVEANGYNKIGATGVFGTDETGQLAQLLVTEQTQRFISIDPRGVECEIIEVQISSSDPYGDEEDAIMDWWVRYTECTIGAATIVARPALQQAVIALASVDLPDTPIAVENAATAVVVASGGPLEPPAQWFDDPGFHVGDPRLVRQPDGKYACPLTVEDGHIFGHVAYWGQRHTGARNMTPPRSATGYAHYLTGQGVKCSGGETVYGVGQVTMGCGHAPTVGVSPAAARAHYDGGYGAIQVADVRAGEDDFGIWVSGALRSDLTPEDLRTFMATGLSGDWRRIGPGLEMLAVLAGVPVQGFPITRVDALAASGQLAEELLTRAGLDSDGEIMSLVASGRVHRIPTDDRLAALEGIVGLMAAERQDRINTENAGIMASLLDLIDA